MSDVAYVVLTVALFAVLALALRGLERLVGEPEGHQHSELDGPERSQRVRAERSESRERSEP